MTARMARLLSIAAACLWWGGVSLSAQAVEVSADMEQLYNTYCVQCHGLQRNGKGVNTPDMSVQPRDHTDPDANDPAAQHVRGVVQAGVDPADC